MYFKHKKTGRIYNKLFEAQDKTEDRLVYIYTSLGKDGRIYTRSSGDFNQNFVPIEN